MKGLVIGIFFSFFLLTSAFGQSFYDVNTIQTIKIYFAFSNWDYRMDTAIAGSDSYSVADSVVVNGTRFTQCGVRFKGNSSYNPTRSKNPLHVKLDLTTSQNYQGYQDFKLGNGFSDPSMEREVLSYQILRQYMDAPLSNWAKVYINGTFYGVMTSSEDISCDHFLDNHFYTSQHTTVKCNPGNVSTLNGSSLLYNGTDSVNYYSKYYDMKSTYGWSNLIHLCDTLNNYTSAINNILDVDRSLWMHAFNNVLVNLDSYSGSFRQNYYLYRNHKNQWMPIVWDLNMSFGGFKNSGVGAPLNLAGEQNMSPVLHSTDANWPLISKLLSSTLYMHMYIAHMRTMNSENFISGQYKTFALALHTLVDNAVSTDPNYLFTYSQFQSALTTTSGNSYGIYQVMDARATFLSTTTQFQQVPPVITNILTVPATPVFANPVTVTANVANTNAVYLGYRYVKSDRFARVQMFDDGTHGDGGAGDNVFGISIPASSLEIQYYIYADNVNAGMFSPERAEHEFYVINPSIAAAVSGDIVINEVEANNQDGISNEDGKHKDWIELYNKTNNALGLSGLYLSDDIANPLKWKFPSIAFIPANGFLLVWADDLDTTFLDHHANFNLSNMGDSLFLTNSSLVYFDSTSFSAVSTDTAYARCPDGTGTFQLTIQPTPRTSNNCVMSAVDLLISDNAISIFPNPATGQFRYMVKENIIVDKIEICNVTGQVVRSLQPVTARTIAIERLPSGLYFVTFSCNTGLKQTLKLFKQ